MSKQVDERVVSMQFDNRQFEKNVQTSMSTIDRLKQKLNFSNSAKGLDNLNSAAKKVDLSSIGNGVEAVRAKFSALDVMGVTVLSNLTNSAVNAGKRIASALTIEPVKTGFQEYETQINAIQIILANTQKEGTNVEQVNAALDELNYYADKTIYNFTEMTRNIGTFTAAGVDLKTSVSAIQGIANLAAVSGSTSIQASTAMYQLSQALAAGKVSLQDWNSVVNAGMGGQVFQDALKETSRLLGTGAEAAIKTTGSFRESLRKGWLTAEVLTATLDKFTTSGANEYVAEYTGLSKEAVEAAIKSAEAQHGEADAIEYASKALAEKSGKSAEEIKSVLSMAKTAEEAATKVKTFSQLWDTLKEAVQSGWGQTWRLIIGDFDQAKELFTKLSDFFGGIIGRISDFRNNLLEGALANPFTSFLDKLKGSSIGKVADKIENITMSLEEYQKVVTDVWRGDYDNAPRRFDLLDKAGYNHQVVQDLVNKGYLYNLTVEDIKASEEKFGVSLDKTAESAEETAKQFENLSDEQLKNAGLTEDEIAMYRDLEKQSKKTGKSISELVDEMSKKDGRTLLLESFENAGKGLVSIIGAIKDAWLEVFPPPTVMQIYNIISGLNEFSKKLIVSGETADKLKRTFKGLFSILHIISTVVGGVLNTAFNFLKQILGAFNLDILDVTASVGDAIVKFDEWLSSVFDFTEVIKKVVPYVIEAGEAIREWFSGIKDADNIPKYIVEGLVNGLIEGVKLVGNAAVELGKAIVERIKNFLGIHSPSTTFIEIGQNIISGLVIGIQNGVSFVWETLKNIVSKGAEIIKSINWGTLIAVALSGGVLYAITTFAKAINKLASPLEGLGDILSGAGQALSGFGKYLKGLAFSVRVNAIKNLILALSLLIGAVILLTFVDKDKLWDAVGVLAAITGILAALVLVVSGLAVLSDKMGAGSIKFTSITLGLIGISAAFLILATVIKRIGSLKPEQAKQGFIGMTGLIVELGVLMAAFGLLVKGKSAQNIGGLGKTLLTFSIALLILVGVIKLIANMGTRDLLKGLSVIFVLELFFVGLIAASNLAGKNAGKIGPMLLRMAVALAILAVVMKLISKMTWDEIGKGIVGMLALVGIITLLTLVTKIGGKTAPKLGKMLLAMAVSIALLVVVAKLIAGMKWDELAKGVAGIIVFGLIVSGLLYVAALANGKTAKLAGMLIAMSVAIGLLAGIAVLLGMVDVKHLAKGVVAVAALAGIVSMMLWASKGVTGGVGVIVTLVIAIAILVAALVGLSFIDSGKLLTTALSLTAVMLAFALMIAAAGTLKKTGDFITTLMPLVGVVAILAVILGAMSLLNVESSLQNAGALAILLISLSAAMCILGNTKAVSKAMVGNMAIMALVVGELALILGVMDGLNVEASIPTALALSILLEAMAAAMWILGNTKAVSKAMVGNMAIMALVVGELALILGVMDGLNVEASIPTALALSILLEAMAAAMWILGNTKAVSKAMVGNMALMGLVVGELALILGVMDGLNVEASIPTALALSILLEAMAAAMLILTGSTIVTPAMVGNMALMGLVVGELALILGVMDGLNVEASIPTAIALSILLVAMSVSLDIVALAGVAAPAALAGIGLLAVLVTAVGVLLGIIGGLLTAFPSAEEFIDKGLPILEKIGTGIGSFFGSLVTGFIEKASETIPILGTRLSEFMANIQPFLDGASSIDPSVVDGVGSLAKVILLITAAEILEGISRFFLGTSSIDTFSEQLPVLGKGLKDFAGSIEGITPAQIESVRLAASVISVLAETADKIPNSGWLLGLIVGNNDIDDFAKQFKTVGEGLHDLVGGLDGFDDTSVKTIRFACDAISILAETADKIPNSGWLLGLIVGNNDIDDFAKQFKTVGEGLHDLVGGLDGFDDTSVKTIRFACDAISVLASASKGIDGQADWTKIFVGDNSIGAFSDQFGTLGTNMKTFADNLGTFGKEQRQSISSAVGAINSFAALADADLKGAKKQLDGFGEKMVDFSDNLSKFIDNMPTSSEVKAATDNINNLLKTIGNISSTDTSKSQSFSKSLSDLAKNGISSFTSAFSSSTTKSEVKTASNGFFSNFISGIKSVFSGSSAKSDIESVSSGFVSKFADGITDNTDDVTKAFKDVAEAAKKALTDEQSSFYDAGLYLVDGTAAGISENDYKVANKATSMANKAIRAAQIALGEHSPSKVFRQIGDYAGQGFVNGLVEYGAKSYAASQEMATSAKKGLSDSISKIRDIIESDVDAQPTIRPVLDLSDVRTGMSAVSGLFDSRTTMGLTANVGAISSRMNRNIQNGRNDEVVSAINSLRKDLGESAGNSYTINGITYDDGSNVSEAVKALVRAARVERRK